MNLYALGPAITDIFVQPTAVFAAIKNGRLSALIALLLLLTATVGIFGWYFMTVDIERFVLSAALQSGQVITPAQLNAIKGQATVIRMTSIVGGVISQIVLVFLLALYLFLVATVTSEIRVTYSQWLSLVAWSGLPALIGLLSMGAAYAVSQGTFVSIEALNQTTLNNVLFHLGPGDSGYALANAVSVGGLWSWVLYTLGFSYLTGGSRVVAALVLAVPVVALLGLLLLV